MADRPVLVLGGDVMLGRGVDQVLSRPCPPELHEPWLRSAVDYVTLAERHCGRLPRGLPPSWVWGDALPALDALPPHLRIVNLETAVTRRGTPAPKDLHYRTAPEHVAVLTAGRIDAVTLANNHLLDWGEEGLRDTLAALDGAGVPHAGAGRDLAEAEAPRVLPLGDRRVVLVAAGTWSSGIERRQAATPTRPGVHLLATLGDGEARRLAALADAVARPGDVRVASLHWGGNWGHAVPAEHRAFAHALVDAGFDVVHGHSSHHPMAAELRRGRPILYGCGDLVNDYEGIGGHEAYRPDLVLLWVLSLGGEAADVRMLPFRLRRFRLQRATPEESAWLARTLGAAGAPLGTGVDVEGDVLALRG